MSTATTYRSDATTVETLDSNTDSSAAARRTVTHDEFNTAKTLSASTTPPATTCAYFVQTLTAGAATIDLTSLTGANDASVDGTGLKVQILKFKNLGANDMSIEPGATNGYDVGGSDMKVTLAQNMEMTLYGNDATDDIGATDKTLDLAGTTTQTCEISIVMG